MILFFTFSQEIYIHSYVNLTWKGIDLFWHVNENVHIIHSHFHMLITDVHTFLFIIDQTLYLLNTSVKKSVFAHLVWAFSLAFVNSLALYNHLFRLFKKNVLLTVFIWNWPTYFFFYQQQPDDHVCLFKTTQWRAAFWEHWSQSQVKNTCRHTSCFPQTAACLWEESVR